MLHAYATHDARAPMISNGYTYLAHTISRLQPFEIAGARVSRGVACKPNRARIVGAPGCRDGGQQTTGPAFDDVQAAALGRVRQRGRASLLRAPRDVQVDA